MVSKLIDLVRDTPSIWDTKHVGHKYVKKYDGNWERIANELKKCTNLVRGQEYLINDRKYSQKYFIDNNNDM